MAILVGIVGGLFVFLIGRAVVRKMRAAGGIGLLLVGIAIGGLLVLALQVGPAIVSRLASISSLLAIGAALR